MNKRTFKRRTDRLAALRIDVGLIILSKLGSDQIATELSRQGIRPETVQRVLNLREQRRPALPGEGTRDRRYLGENRKSWLDALLARL